MHDPILKARTFTFEINGVPFEMYRRSTFIMAKARGFQSVLGTLGGQAAVESGEANLGDVTPSQTATMVEGVLRAAQIRPVIAEAGEQSNPPVCYSFEDLAAYHDAAFKEFMASGLEASPSPSSCAVTKEPPTQERST